MLEMEENKEYKQFLDEGIFKIQEGNFKEAISLISKSIELKNDFEISYFYRAVAYHAVCDYDNAMLDYTKSIKLNPKMTDAYYNRAKITLEKGKISEIELKKAIEDLTKALELDPQFIDALYAMAAAKKKAGDYHACLEYLEKLLKIQPDSIHARALKKLILSKYIV